MAGFLGLLLLLLLLLLDIRLLGHICILRQCALDLICLLQVCGFFGLLRLGLHRRLIIIRLVVIVVLAFCGFVVLVFSLQSRSRSRARSHLR